MDIWALILTPLLATISGILGAGGFWSYLQRREDRRSQRTEKISEIDKLVMGLSYEKIITMGLEYIQRGWITDDEYADYQRYFCQPYKKLGGNGVTTRIIAEVENLPMRSRYVFAQEVLQPARARSQASDIPSEPEHVASTAERQ